VVETFASSAVVLGPNLGGSTTRQETQKAVVDGHNYVPWQLPKSGSGLNGRSLCMFVSKMYDGKILRKR
jgi:hypothetical protein